jgi:hypothetical protein
MDIDESSVLDLPVDIVLVNWSKVKLESNIGNIETASRHRNNPKGINSTIDGHVKVESINVESHCIGIREELDLLLVEGDIVNVDVLNLDFVSEATVFKSQLEGLILD